MLHTIDHLSFRIKLPAGLALAIMLSGLVIVAVLLGLGSRDLRENLFVNARDLGRVLASRLIPLIRHDDVWQAYQVLGSASEGETGQHRLLLVLDNAGKVYVSNQPRRFAMQSDPGEVDGEVARLAERIQDDQLVSDRIYEHRGDRNYYVVLSLMDDGVRVGWLILGYPRAELTDQLYKLYLRVTGAAFAVILLLVPVGWLLGTRMARPLTELTERMAEIGNRPAEQIHYLPPKRNDEIGRLGHQFARMLEALAEKERLEHQMVASERLAAIGRVAAGVAHEINNPLGGLLNAVNTFRRHGRGDPLAEKTASLMERGLMQIRDTVSVLLVQARAESHPFTAQDVEDVRALLLPDARKQSVRLDFRTEGERPSALPSTPLRQILINLGLNAIKASPERSSVKAVVRFAAEGVLISMENLGPTIPADRLGHLFEPFVSDRPGGQGLGLWVTYQLVQQLKGEITVFSGEGVTRFFVHLPDGGSEAEV